MDGDSFSAWLSAYGAAWENRDPEMATRLFCEDASYQETPFDEPMKGRQAIRAYWDSIPRFQEKISFRYKILALLDNGGIAEWEAEFIRQPSRTQVHLHGVLVAEFNGTACCQSFKEWWHRQETKTWR